MAISVWPPTGSTTATPSLAYTASQISAWSANLSAVNQAVTLDMVFGRSFSGGMVSISGTFTGLTVAFEASTFDDPTVWRRWSAFHMQQGVWIATDNVVNSSKPAYWIPSNGAVSVRMRVAAISTGTAKAGAIAMHAPANIGDGPIGKNDWAGMVIEQPPGNTVAVMVPIATVASSALVTRTTTLGSSYAIPVGNRLRIHSYAGTYIAGAGGGRCRVDLRSNMTGATVIGSDQLATWTFGPTAGGTGVDERWSGLASALTEPIDIYNNGGGASVGVSAMGSAGTTGKLSLTLFGYLVG